jgi:multicomponent Na+:H+ antiporter subunit D
VPFGIVLYVDRLAALLVLVSSVVLLSVLLFSVGQGAEDGDEDTPVSIFHPSYLILAAGIFTAFIAGDLFNLYVGFEILLVASYVLITLGGTENRIRTGVVYIVVSLVSSILFLAAIGAIYGALGTVNMAQLSERMVELPQETQLVLHLMLVVAFGIKAAVFPLSFWLPDSYPTAPAPVTAVFAGLLTKVGVYALIRTETEIFRDNDINLLLLIVALATMIVGVLGAVAQAELKRILSFTLVSHIGYMIFGLAIATPAAIGATIYYIVHHIVVQTTLFLAIGLVERRAGSTSVLRVRGLMRAAPVIAVLYFIPAVNLGGLPPFSGFIGKYALFDAAAEIGTPIMIVLIVGGIVTSLLTLYALMRAWNLAFWREDEDSAESDERISYLGDSPEAGTKTERRAIPKIMTASTAGMVAVTVALTIFAGPLYEVCTRIGESLLQPVTVVQLEQEAGS